jgi:folate-binding protein YgfZ
MNGAGVGSAGYRAARGGTGVLLREDLGFLEVMGSAPGQMLKGILSGRIPEPLVMEAEEVGRATYAYSTILTPKGKMITDLHLLPSRSGGFLMVLPEGGMEGALMHFKKYLHPKFAQIEERSADLSYLNLVGPGAPGVVEKVLGLEAELLPPTGGMVSTTTSKVGRVSVLRSQEIGVEDFHLILPGGAGEGMRAKALEHGGEAMDMEDWNTLRIEAGRPRFGLDMTTDTIPVEAGIHEEAIDYQKGCYTGQEVIIRLRDRGKVNKRLCLVLFGEVPPPAPGSELLSGESGKKAGWVTSSCRSPRFGQTIALGFIKRGVELGDTVELGGPQGSSGKVAALR